MREEPDFETYHRNWSEAYQGLNYSKSLSSQMIRQSHILVEKPFGPEVTFDRVVEVGSGGGQHFPFVRHRFDEYIMTDASEAMLDIARAAHQRSGVSFERSDPAALHFPDRSFDRLIATHVLEHMERPHAVLREWERVLKPGGRVLAVDFGASEGKEKSVIHRFHRHGRIAMGDLVALFSVPDYEVIGSGAVGMRDLNFVLARAR